MALLIVAVAAKARAMRFSLVMRISSSGGAILAPALLYSPRVANQKSRTTIGGEHASHPEGPFAHCRSRSPRGGGQRSAFASLAGESCDDGESVRAGRRRRRLRPAAVGRAEQEPRAAIHRR